MKSIRDKDFNGKKVLMRVDFNVPVDGEVVKEDFRIAACVPSIEYIRNRGGIIILVSHRGRPKGRDNSLSLRPVARHLASLINSEVIFFDDIAAAKRDLSSLKKGDVAMLENIRFEKGEEECSPDLARELASLRDIFVNEAFAVSHRKHASVYTLPKLSISYAGLLFKKEIYALDSLLSSKRRPIVFILGGAKASSKIKIIESARDLVDTFCVGGVLANEIFAARGMNIGLSVVSDDKDFREYVRSIDHKDKKVVLPLDVVVSPDIDGDGGKEIKMIEEIEDDDMILDIGPQTVDVFANHIIGAKIVFWNGPLGRIEDDDFDFGTLRVIDSFNRSDAEITVGGGDAIMALDMAKARSSVDHISTGGGSTLLYLAERSLPGIEALN